MGTKEVIAGFQERFSQIVRNVKSRSVPEWILFFVVIPLLLYLVYLLPQNFKDAYLIFNMSEPYKVHTFLLNEYVHSEAPHLWANVSFYVGTMLAIFAFENDKKRFRIMMCSAFLLVPIIATTLTVIFWNLIHRNATSQGFSGIAAALSAYAMMVFLFWAMHDVMPLFKQSAKIKGRKTIGYLIMCILVALVFSLVIIFGFQLGMFVGGENTVSNGIAHFGGFITALIVLLIYDLIQKDRALNFDISFGLSIVIGIYVYIPYLLKIIESVNNAVP